jgi:hypothetical protein
VVIHQIQTPKGCLSRLWGTSGWSRTLEYDFAVRVHDAAQVTVVYCVEDVDN